MKRQTSRHFWGATAFAILGHIALIWGLVIAQKPLVPRSYVDIDPLIIAIIPPDYYVRNNIPAYPKDLPFEIRRSKTKETFFVLPVPESLLADKDHKREDDHKSPTDNADAPNVVPNPEANGHLRGRSALQQALQFRKSCVDWQMAGEYPDSACQMPSLSGNFKGLGADPRRQERFKLEMEAKEYEDTYKRSAGSPDYWKRVNRSPSPRYEPEEEAPPGSYSDPKDQRTHSNGIPIRP